MTSPSPIIVQDEFAPNNILECTLKEDIIRLFKIQGYSSLEADTISFWKKKGHNELNGLLRVGIVNDKIRLLDSAIERSLMKESYVLYRGLSKEGAEGMRNLGKGSIYRPGQFTSMSRQLEIAYKYAHGNSGIIIEARTKPETKGIIFGDINYEDEVLLPRTIQFLIIDIRHGVDDAGNSTMRYICEVKYGN